jgi:hypothetical protein
LTVNEFQNCVKVFGFGTPSVSIAQAFINETKADGSISTKLEAYMAARREWACSGGRWSAQPCESYDKKGCPAGNFFLNRK